MTSVIMCARHALRRVGEHAVHRGGHLDRPLPLISPHVFLDLLVTQGLFGWLPALIKILWVLFVGGIESYKVIPHEIAKVIFRTNIEEGAYRLPSLWIIYVNALPTLNADFLGDVIRIDKPPSIFFPLNPSEIFYYTLNIFIIEIIQIDTSLFILLLY